VSEQAPLQVLVVEMQALESRQIDDLLEGDRPREVVRVASVAEARAALATRRFDVVITDETRLRAVLDGLFAFVGVFSLDGVVVDVNKAPLATGNLKITDVVGRRFIDLPWWSHSPIERDRIADALARSATGESLRFDTTVRRVVGGFLHIDAAFAPLRDSTGAITHVLGSGVDVTARHQAEEALIRSEARLAEAQRIAHLGSWEWDTRKDVVTWSDELFSVYGVDRAAFNGTYEAFLACVHPDDLERTKEIIRGALERRASFVFEHRLIRRDGTIGMVHARGEVVCDPENPEARPLRMVGSVQDITEIWESRQQLRALAARLDAIREDERRTLSREIHDRVGQDLTALKLDLASLRSRLPSDPEVDKRVARMDALIDDTLATARRVAADLRPVLLEDLGLAAAIEGQARDFQARTGIPWAVAAPTDLPPLDDAAALALYRILQEALTNIARHAQARQVKIALVVADQELVLTVEDDGRGITPAELGRPTSLGLVGMRERALVVGGSVTIAARRPAGTSVIARVPLRGTTR
jgi:PAS domain S-box-containing protein